MSWLSTPILFDLPTWSILTLMEIYLFPTLFCVAL